MKKLLAAFGLIGFLGFGALAIAATGSTPVVAPTGQQLTTPVQVCGSLVFNAGPQASAVAACGGSFTCTNGGTITVANTNLTANSVVIFGMKTVSGTPANPIMTTVTPGTSFVATCGASDASVWNYVILG